MPASSSHQNDYESTQKTVSNQDPGDVASSVTAPIKSGTRHISTEGKEVPILYNPEDLNL